MCRRRFLLRRGDSTMFRNVLIGANGSRTRLRCLSENFEIWFMTHEHCADADGVHCTEMLAATLEHAHASRIQTYGTDLNIHKMGKWHNVCIGSRQQAAFKIVVYSYRYGP